MEKAYEKLIEAQDSMEKAWYERKGIQTYLETMIEERTGAKTQVLLNVAGDGRKLEVMERHPRFVEIMIGEALQKQIRQVLGDEGVPQSKVEFR